MCGKIAKLLYTTLKTNQKYDSKKHAEACGIPWQDMYDKKAAYVDPNAFHEKASEYLGEAPTGDIETEEIEV